MGITLGEVFPNFEADSTIGKLKFHDWLGNSWGVLFSHPRDFTPVCTTELGRVIQLEGDFKKRGVKLIALSCDNVADHKEWSEDVKCLSGVKGDMPYPIIADETRELAVKLGMVDPDERTSTGMPLTCRAVFIIGPDKKLKLSILYPATTGRNFSEILRVIDSLQLTAQKKVATPADWQPGDRCMVVPGVSAEEAKTLFPNMEVKAVPSGKGYLRYTPQPK
uniref:Peroxiredoxin 6 n=1 Tax=Arenicola marina TaxID=6344 RepID=Q1AN22_AREMA|nr:peroxiredoxin 6 [Arenicola marina]